MDNKINRTKKITYCAVGAAVTALCVFLTNILPLKFSLLMFAALVYFIIFCKCGFVFGLIDIIASLLVAFFLGGMSLLNSAVLLTCVVFAPYALLCFIIKKFSYNSVKTAFIRIAIIIVFAIAALAAMVMLAGFITSIDIAGIILKVGGVVVLGVIFVPLTIVFDFLFNMLASRLMRLIK